MSVTVAPVYAETKEQMIALRSRKAKRSNELTFVKGDIIILLSKDHQHWWRGQLGSAIGLFPVNYVQPLSLSVPPLPAALPAVEASPPCPPNWTQSLQQATTQVQSLYLKIPVLETTAEYREIRRLFGADMVSVERVVNPTLWKKFTQARLDLLVSKSDDLSLLAALGLSDEEVALRAHVSLNFDKSHLNGSPYSDNVVLLFHGSRGRNLDNILSQGLDERLGKNDGLLGRGIYFSDDPRKAMQYVTYDKNGYGVLVVFAVVLGDCLAIKGQNRDAVREPEKTLTQRRNHQDLFFDSIVGRPTGANSEIVIFKGGQCYPIFTIKFKYNKSALPPPQPGLFNPPTNRALTPEEELTVARNQVPSFAWNYGGRQKATPSPFCARKIFQAMAADQIGLAEEGAAGGVPRGSAPTTSTNMNAQDEFQAEESLMLQLTELGFSDDTRNKGLLRTFGFNLQQTIDYLLEEASKEATAGAGEDTANAGAEGQATPEVAGPVGGTAALTINNGTNSKSIASTLASAAAACLPSTSKGITASTPPLAPPAPKFDETIDLTNDTLNDETIEKEDEPEKEPKLPKAKSKSKQLALAKITFAKPQSKPNPAPISSAVSYRITKKNPNPQAQSQSQKPGKKNTTSTTAADKKAETARAALAKVQPASPADSECPICSEEYPAAGSDWKTLSCEHKICTTCCAKIKSTGTTMIGQTHSYLKCPFCKSCTGIQIGT